MKTVRVTKAGRSQIIRLPKECHFNCRQVMVNRVGDLVMLFPRGKGWKILADSRDSFTDDFMARRDQPARAEERRKL